MLGRPQAERQAGDESLYCGRVHSGHRLQRDVDLPAVHALVLVHKGPAGVEGEERFNDPRGNVASERGADRV